MRASRSSPENRQTARLRRAFVFYLLEHEMSDQDADAAAKKLHGLGHSFWMKLDIRDDFERRHPSRRGSQSRMT